MVCFDGLDSKLCMQMHCGALGRHSTGLFPEQTVPVTHFRQKVLWTLHLHMAVVEFYTFIPVSMT